MAASFRDRFRFRTVGASPLSLSACLSPATLKFCVFAILVGSTARPLAADDPAESKTELPRRSVFGLTEFFKRGQASAYSDTPVVSNRFVLRTLELLAEARALEKDGKAEAALEMAQRAESVFNVAQHTTGISWPESEESPEQYIVAMKRRTGVTGESTATTAGKKAFAASSAGLLSKPASAPAGSTTTAEGGSKPVSTIGTTPRAATANSGGANFAPIAATQLLLDWGNRTPSSGIALTAGTQDNPSTESAEKVRSVSDKDESSLLLKQLDQLESRTASKPAAELNPPLIIPRLIKRPDGIDDSNVGPIPTRPTETVSGSPSEATTTTIPIVPDLSDRVPPLAAGKPAKDSAAETTVPKDDQESSVYDAAPRLLTQSDGATLVTAISDSDGSESSETTVWQLAAAQLISTFLGVIFAVGLFLLIRAAASKYFGTRLGVTFQFGLAANSTARPNVTDESADVVPFGETSRPASSGSTSQPNEPKRAGGVANPADFPFRIVGTSGGEEEHITEERVEQERDSAILKSVFEHNVELLGSLDKNKGSAA